jgi:dTMP kinase
MDIIPNLIVFEGGDGSGTTTQLNMLRDHMKKIGNPLFFPTFEPFNGKSASNSCQIIRSVLKKEIKMSPEDLCRLFALNRKEHLYEQDGIMEHIEKGELVASDRYVISSLVYQGIECGDELPKALNPFPAPEITFFLDVDVEIAHERMKERTCLEIFENMEFQKKVREKYLSVIKTYREEGARVEIIDASKTKEEVAGEIWSIIAKMPIFNKE